MLKRIIMATAAVVTMTMGVGARAAAAPQVVPLGAAISSQVTRPAYTTPPGCSTWMEGGTVKGSCSVTSTIRYHYVRLYNNCAAPAGDLTSGWIYATGIAIYASAGSCWTGTAARFWQMQ